MSIFLTLEAFHVCLVLYGTILEEKKSIFVIILPSRAFYSTIFSEMVVWATCVAAGRENLFWYLIFLSRTFFGPMTLFPAPFAACLRTFFDPVAFLATFHAFTPSFFFDYAIFGPVIGLSASITRVLYSYALIEDSFTENWFSFLNFFKWIFAVFKNLNFGKFSSMILLGFFFNNQLWLGQIFKYQLRLLYFFLLEIILEKGLGG